MPQLLSAPRFEGGGRVQHQTGEGCLAHRRKVADHCLKLSNGKIELRRNVIRESRKVKGKWQTIASRKRGGKQEALGEDGVTSVYQGTN